MRSAGIKGRRPNEKDAEENDEPTDITGPVIFDEQFSTSTLPPPWTFVQQFSGRGRYSLTDKPGFFRFYGEGSLTSDEWPWYPGWTDPWPSWTGSDYLFRTFEGDHWVLRSSATFHLRGYAPQSSGAQWSVLRIGFGEGNGPLFHICRIVDKWYNLNTLGVQSQNAPGGYPMSIPEGMFRDSDDVYNGPGWVNHTYWYEIARDGQQVTVGISKDGTTFVPAGSFTMPSETGATQHIAITQAQYNPAGSYTDWDWITVHGSRSENQPPVVSGITVPANPVAVGTTISATASFTDAGDSGTHTAVWNWGDGTTSPGTAAGDFVSGEHAYASAGIYGVTVTVTDGDGAASTVDGIGPRRRL